MAERDAAVAEVERLRSVAEVFKGSSASSNEAHNGDGDNAAAAAAAAATEALRESEQLLAESRRVAARARERAAEAENREGQRRESPHLPVLETAGELGDLDAQ